MGSRVTVLAVVVATTFLVAACGASKHSAGSGQTLNFFIFNEPGGGPQKVAQECSQPSGAR